MNCAFLDLQIKPLETDVYERYSVDTQLCIIIMYTVMLTCRILDLKNSFSFSQRMKNSKSSNKYEGWPEALEMDGCVPLRAPLET